MCFLKHVVPALLVVLSCAFAAPFSLAADTAAQPWHWGPRFSSESSKDLRALHWKLHGLGPVPTTGYRVENKLWSAEGLDLKLKEGTLYPLPEVDGVSWGAYFVGDALAAIRPQGRYAKTLFEDRFRRKSFGGVRVSAALLVSFRGRNVFEELGVTGEATIPLADRPAFERVKGAMRMMGSSVTHAFLERDRSARDVVFAWLAVDGLRTRRAKDALLLYRYDPREERECALSLGGHVSMAENEQARSLFLPVTAWSSGGSRMPLVDVEHYELEVEADDRKPQTHTRAVLRGVVREPLRYLRLALYHKLEIESASADGNALDVLRWDYDSSSPNPDPHVVLDLGRELAANERFSVALEVSGHRRPLEATLRDGPAWEEDWYPRARDWRDKARYDLTIACPRRQKIAAPGTLVEETVERGVRRAHYRIDQEQGGVVFAMRHYVDGVVNVAGTELVTRFPTVTKNEQYRQEVELAESAFAHLAERLGPLGEERLELAESGSFRQEMLAGERFEFTVDDILVGSGAPIDKNRAVGNVTIAATPNDTTSVPGTLQRVRALGRAFWTAQLHVREWPQDRWLLDAVPAYVAVDYLEREGPKAVFRQSAQDHIRDFWFDPIIDVEGAGERDEVSGAKKAGASVFRAGMANLPLALGGRITRSRAPLMLHMLRELVIARTGDDEKFWGILREYRSRYRGKVAGTPEFVALVNETLGENTVWFFNQWLWSTEMPSLAWSWEVRDAEHGVELVVDVEQDAAQTPQHVILPLSVTLADGTERVAHVEVDEGRGELVLPLEKEPRKVKANANRGLLARVAKR